MNASAVIEYLQGGFPDLRFVQAGGETRLILHRGYSRGICFAAVRDKNGLCDTASGLDRAGVFRLSFNAGKACFSQHFGAVPTRFAHLHWPHDPGALNVLLPHPVFAWLGWVCLLNPEAETLRRLQPALEQAYVLALQRHYRKAAYA